MNEIWRDIVDYEGIYQVSNLGRVKRLSCSLEMGNQSTRWQQSMPELIFKPAVDTKGYPQVGLSIGGKRKLARVHRLVAEVFLEPPTQELIDQCSLAGLDYVLINHKDHDITNNQAQNLEWCSPAHNTRWCVEAGRTSDANNGEKCVWSKLTDEEALEVYKEACLGRTSQEEIAAIYGIRQITVSNIKTGRSWAWLTGQEKKARTRRAKQRSLPMAEQIPARDCH